MQHYYRIKSIDSKIAPSIIAWLPPELQPTKELNTAKPFSQIRLTAGYYYTYTMFPNFIASSGGRLYMRSKARWPALVVLCYTIKNRIYMDHN